MLLVEIARYLHEIKLGVFDEKGVKGNIFIDVVPGKPDECISLFSTGGQRGDIKNGYTNPTFQCWIRGGSNPLKAINKANEVYKALNGFSGKSFVPGGHHIVDCIGIQSGPIRMGTDSNERHQYSLNFESSVKDR